MKLDYLETNYYYHIYNRGINSCAIFKNSRNYVHFLNLLSRHLLPHITVLSYCLLINHFHLVIYVNSDHKIVTQKFSNFFNAYAKSFNKEQDRTGSLFEKHFKRIRLQSESYLKNLIIYTHTNPQKHGFIENFKDYRYSSYDKIILENSQLIDYKSVINLFDDIDNFKYVHAYKSLILNKKYSIEQPV